MSTGNHIPDDLFYTPEHEWAKLLNECTLRIGITDFAQSALGDVVFVQLPDQGTYVTAGESFGEVESTKSVSDLYAPVSGMIIAVNDALTASPHLVNSDPYGQGWLVEITVDPTQITQLTEQLSQLLQQQAYQKFIGEQH